LDEIIPVVLLVYSCEGNENKLDLYWIGLNKSKTRTTVLHAISNLSPLLHQEF